MARSTSRRRERHNRREARRNLVAIAILVGGSLFAGWLASQGSPACRYPLQLSHTLSVNGTTFRVTPFHSDGEAICK